MTKRLPCPPAPGPLEAYAVLFDDLFGTLAQRRGSRASRSRLDRVPESEHSSAGADRAQWRRNAGMNLGLSQRGSPRGLWSVRRRGRLQGFGGQFAAWADGVGHAQAGAVVEDTEFVVHGVGVDGADR